MKKRMTKVAAIMLAATMVLGMGTVSFAAPGDTPGGSITVTNLTNSVDTTVKIYKVASLDTNGNNWVIEDWAKDIVASVNGGSDYVYKEGKSMTDLKTAATTATATKTDEETKGTVEFTGLGIGSYLVLATDDKAVYNPMIADVFAYGTDNLATTKAVEIIAKGETYKTDKTENDLDNVVATGDIVTYTITSTVPYISPDTTNASYTITDTITGADYAFDAENGFAVTVGDKAYEIEKPTTKGTFTLDLKSLLTDNAKAGQTVVITYKAVVNAVDEVTNDARSDHDATDEHSSTKLFTGQATITKTDDAASKNPLAGAKFALYRSVMNEETGEESKEYATIDANGYITGEWTAVANPTETNVSTVTTGTNGTATVKGLDAGTYYFQEIVAPAGYSINTDDKEVVIELTQPQDSDAEVTEADDRSDITMGSNSMADTKLSELPSTGGIGTTIFTVGGCAIVVIAGGLLIVSRRKKA